MPEGGGDSVKVAVRVRPFIPREIERGSKCVIQMQNNMTIITNPQSKEEPKKFSFDYSYWSHDGFVTLDSGIMEPKPGTVYASQRKVFDDLGQGVLSNAFEGYNCSLFAYGQTGSGKSYSMVGYGPNKGIVPITCDELFKAISSNTNNSTRFEVSFAMIEIYNEQVRDLLSKDNPKGGLQVRQNPTLGMFYVENLKKVPVGSYTEIEKRMEQGTSNRTVASTNMNATSSRGHTVVTIMFDQISKNDADEETKKSSTMNLVDLAGSERAGSTGAVGDRLKEGANINRSLSALGNVISALAEMSTGKSKKVVPYRDSVLTKLLQNALGGNSKTVMIAALSPADINYDETMSTLRFADRAKKIKTQAVVNENPLDRMIKELKAENEKLKQALEGGGVMPMESAKVSPEEYEQMLKEMEEIRAQLTANQQMISEQGVSWDEKLSAARDETEAFAQEESREHSRKSRDPHLKNLNEDPMLSGVVFHFLGGKKTTFGRKDGNPTITLNGLSIQKNHAVLTNDGNEVSIKPASEGAKIRINGLPVTGIQTLENMDRVMFGSNHMYVFINPNKRVVPEGTPKEITWEFAQKEIAQAKGFGTGLKGLSKEQQIAQEQILEILPMVTEVNAVSEELNKHKSFEVVLVPAAAQSDCNAKTDGVQSTGLDHSKSIGGMSNARVMVKMKNLLNGNTWLWERDKFMNRRYLMQEMYQHFLDGEDVFSIPKVKDPFWEPTEDVLIGTASVILQCLSYAMDSDDNLIITDYKGTQEGRLSASVIPCTENGLPLSDQMVDDPKELIGKPFHFKIVIDSAEIEKSRFSRGISVKYRLLTDKEFTETKLIKDTLMPQFKHSRLVSLKKITSDHIEFFNTKSLTFLIYGKQEDSAGDPKLSKLTTKELRQMEQMSANHDSGRRQSVFAHDASKTDISHLKTEVVLLQRKYDRLAQKERRIMQICDEWAKKPEDEQEFAPFFRAVSAAAHSTGTRLRTRVQLLNQVLAVQKQQQAAENNDMLRGQKLIQEKNRVHSAPNQNGDDDDTVSLFVFGEEERDLAVEADKSDGVIEYDKIRKHHFEIEKSNIFSGSEDFPSNNGGGKQEVKRAGDKKNGSSACIIM